MTLADSPVEGDHSLFFEKTLEVKFRATPKERGGYHTLSPPPSTREHPLSFNQEAAAGHSGQMAGDRDLKGGGLLKPQAAGMPGHDCKGQRAVPRAASAPADLRLREIHVPAPQRPAINCGRFPFPRCHLGKACLFVCLFGKGDGRLTKQTWFLTL